MNKNLTNYQKFPIGNSINYSKEHILWTGKPSQLMNFNIHLFSLVFFIIVLYLYKSYYDFFLFGLIFPFFLSILAVLKTYFTIFVLTNERLIKKYGIFNRYTPYIELYRVKDVRLVEPFLYRFFNLGNIRLVTSQETLKLFFVPAIHKPKLLRENLRVLVEERRKERGVREFDTN